MLPIGDGGPEESESESCRVSSAILSSCLGRGDSGSGAAGGNFFSIVLVKSNFGGRRFETGKGDNGGVDSFSMSWILSKGRVTGIHTRVHYIIHN